MHLFVDRAGYQDSARFGQFLQSRRDIDAVAIDVVALDHHVAQIDPDPESHPLRFGQPAIVAGELLLHLDRALHGLHDAHELGDDGVAPGVDDAPFVAFDQRRHGLAGPAQRRQRARFVSPHEASISLNIGA